MMIPERITRYVEAPMAPSGIHRESVSSLSGNAGVIPEMILTTPSKNNSVAGKILIIILSLFATMARKPRIRTAQNSKNLNRKVIDNASTAGNPNSINA